MNNKNIYRLQIADEAEAMSLFAIAFYHPVALRPKVREIGRKRLMATFSGKAWELMANIQRQKNAC